MPSLVIPTAVQVRLRWTFNGVSGFNVLGGSVGGGFASSQAIANTLGTAVNGYFTSSGLAALMATTTSLLGIGLRDIRVANQPEFQSAAAAVPGTGVGNPIPNEVAAVITLRTALAGRSFRGRAYFSGAIVTQNSATGSIVAGFNTALTTFMTNVQTALAASGITLAVLSRTDSVATPVTLIQARDTEWDTQRRRKH